MRSFLSAAALFALCGVWAGEAAAQDPACVDPQLHCGAMVEPRCLQRLGASADLAEVPRTCDGQLEDYRDCLVYVSETCASARAPDGGVGAIEASLLEALAALGGLIAEPKTPIEFYNNARVYERRGDALSARRMYEKAIAKGLRGVDLHQRYMALLKAQEGLLGARELYAEMLRNSPEDPTMALASALLAPAPMREAALRKLTDHEKPFSPAFFEIAALYAADRLGAQSLEDKRSEKAALEAYLNEAEAGRVYRWFLDKAVADQRVNTARKRFAPYQNQTLDRDPVLFTATPSNSSWTVTLAASETARAFRVSVDDGPVKELGSSQYIDQTTGEKAPKSYFSLPLGVDNAQIKVWYDDIRNEQRGPFTYEFKAQDAFAAFGKLILSDPNSPWISGRDYDGGHLIYFTHLVSSRCGLQEIAYGVNADTPNEVWPLSPCDPKNPSAIGDNDQIYLTFDSRVEKVAVQITYGDGEKSDVRVFLFE